MEFMYTLRWSLCTPSDGVYVPYVYSHASESYSRRLGSLVLCLCDVFPALMNSSVQQPASSGTLLRSRIVFVCVCGEGEGGSVGIVSCEKANHRWLFLVRADVGCAVFYLAPSITGSSPYRQRGVEPFNQCKTNCLISC